IGENIFDAYTKAYEADPTSIFGGIVAANREIDGATAAKLNEIFLEIVLAPGYSEEALAILKQKKNIRLLQTAPEAVGAIERFVTSVEGGALVQDSDRRQLSADDIKVVTDRQPTEEEMKQLLFAWKVVKHVKSNAIVLAKNNMTIGVGAGQMNRVGAAKIAIEQAGDLAVGGVLASDAFFPMSDTLELAAAAGITAIVQPGGSIKDEDSIRVANEKGIAMIFTGVRHFKH
ncbi:MAG: bifunctional phosphoribosylaminoimidazolecarboxamide formyltransferase/IMP cyclohydrolase, partial [Bacillota bacterium]